MLLEKTKGNEPKKETKIQPNVTINNASRAFTLLCFIETLVVGKPTIISKTIVYIKAFKSLPPVKKDIAKGGKRAMASNRSRLPNTFIMIA